MVSSKPLTIAISFGVVALSAAQVARAQSVSLDNGTVEIFDGDGDSAVLIDNGADYTAGGDGRSAVMELRDLGGFSIFSFSAALGQLVLGGGTQEGIFLVKDNDGITTTIDLDGRTGRILLGALGEDGDLIVNDGNAVETIRLNGANGTVTNNEDGNGLIKAWAKVDDDGTLVSCWRCVDSFRLIAGSYLVQFNEDIGSRPRTATIDSHSLFDPFPATIRLSDVDSDTVSVRTADNTNALVDRAFTLVIY